MELFAQGPSTFAAQATAPWRSFIRLTHIGTTINSISSNTLKIKRVLPRYQRSSGCQKATTNALMRPFSSGFADAIGVRPEEAGPYQEPRMQTTPLVEIFANRLVWSSRAVLLPSAQHLKTPWGCNAAQSHHFRRCLVRKFRAQRGGAVTFPSLYIRSRRGTSLAPSAGIGLKSACACGVSQTRGAGKMKGRDDE